MSELRGPEVPEREQAWTQAYVHVMKDEWFEAIAKFESLLFLEENPAAGLWSSYATCLMNVGRAREAADAYAKALTIPTESPLLHLHLRENIIFCRDQCDDTTAEQGYQRRREFWDLHMKELAEKHAAPHLNDRDPERPLRVGYVSADFRSHSANMSFGAVIMRHTPGVQVYCYSSANPNLWDLFTTLYSQQHVVRVIDGEPDAEVAQWIRRDKIDILVDLSSFSNGGRMSLFAMKPAPIQVTAWGYVLGTGLDTMDVIFGDPVAMPYSSQDYYRERIVHLPSIIPYVGQMYAPEVAVLPCLKANEPFTFGCFNRAAKIGDTTLRMWSKILKALPESRLLLKEGQIGKPYHRERILKALDVAPERVAFGGQTPHRAHLEAFAQVDLALDPYPIAGGVSMLEGLWQGVPALVRYSPDQKRVCSLVGVSALKILGMNDFIASNEDEYVRLAVRWATEGRDKLAQWRLQLRKLMFNSPLIQGYMETVEDTYRDLFRDWCKQAA